MEQQIFKRAQAEYAAHGIATFPVKGILNPRNGKIDKIPAISNYGKVGLRGSAKLAAKFADARGVGFMAGRRSGIVIIDVDSADERLLGDALDRHGETPIIAKTASGGHFGRNDADFSWEATNKATDLKQAAGL